MQVLCLDIGSGTQDILLLDTAQNIENAIQLVLPAPTVLVARKIEAATARGESLILNGDTMGGGACTSAIRRHLDAGLAVCATENAARTFSDDLEKVASWGIKLISPDELAQQRKGTTISLSDIDLALLEKALSNWNVTLRPDIVAVAVLDHGMAPAGQSERIWRFSCLEQLLKANRTLEAFMFTESEVPSHFTRMQAVARTIGNKVPLVLMDTGAAAVLGASFDSLVSPHENRLVANLGNSHTIAFNLSGPKVLGFFEHHTSALTESSLENLLLGLTAGTLKFENVWEEGGHGSLIIEKGSDPFIATTGPRRSLLANSRLNPYPAAPFGSMMLAGCFGLLKAASVKFPQWRDDIESALLRG